MSIYCMYIYLTIYIYIYTYIYRERERESERKGYRESGLINPQLGTVICKNFPCIMKLIFTTVLSALKMK